MQEWGQEGAGIMSDGSKRGVHERLSQRRPLLPPQRRAVGRHHRRRRIRHGVVQYGVEDLLIGE